MKRTIIKSLLLPAIILMCATSVFADTEVLLEETWESYEVGDRPGEPWEIELPDLSEIQIISNDISKFVQLDFQGQRLFWSSEKPLISGQLVIEFDFNTAKMSSSYFHVRNRWGDIGLSLSIGDRFVSAFKWDMFWECAYVTTIKVMSLKIVVDFNREQIPTGFSVFVDGNSTKCTDFPVEIPGWEPSPITHLQKFEFVCVDNYPLLYDNISIECKDCVYKYDDPDDDDDDDDDNNDDNDTSPNDNSDDDDDDDDGCCGC